MNCPVCDHWNEEDEVWCEVCDSRLDCDDFDYYDEDETGFEDDSYHE